MRHIHLEVHGIPFFEEILFTPVSTPPLRSPQYGTSLGSQANLLARVVLAATATGLLGREARIVKAIAPPVAVSLARLILVGALYG